MPILYDEDIYPQEDFWWRIPGVIADAGGGSESVVTGGTVEYEVFRNGVSQGPKAPMTYSAARRGMWEVKVRAPTTAGTYELRATFVTAFGRGEVRDTFTVTA